MELVYFLLKLGRDMYISFNNGGALRTVISYSQEKYHTTPKRNHRNLSI